MKSWVLLLQARSLNPSYAGPMKGHERALPSPPMRSLSNPSGFAPFSGGQ